MPLNFSWRISIVDTAGFSTWSSIAFSPTGQPAVAYYSSDNGALRFATLNAGGTWDVETVDASGGDCGPHLRYRFSQPAISYVASHQDLRYAIKRGSAPPWTIDTIAPAGSGNSLAFDAGQHVGISYHKKDDGLGYIGSRTPSVWVGSSADADVRGSFNSIAFGPSGQPAIAYQESGGSHWADERLKYVAFDGAHWNKQTVGPGGGWCTLAFSPAGEPAVTYVLTRSSADSSVMYAVLRGGSWHTETIADSATAPSLAFTPAGEPAISYYDRAAAAVKYAVFANGAWQHSLVDQTGKDQNGVWSGEFTLTSLAFSLGGQPAISYYDRANGQIKCAIRRVDLRGGDRWREILRNLLRFRTTR